MYWLIDSTSAALYDDIPILDLLNPDSAWQITNTNYIVIDIAYKDDTLKKVSPGGRRIKESDIWKISDSE